MAEAKKKRGPGRPKKQDRPVTPEVLDQIRALYVRGKGARKIAQIIGTSLTTVQHHLNFTIKPILRQEGNWDSALQMARAEEVIAIAFEGFDRSLRAASKTREKYGPEKSATERLKAKIRKKAPQGLKCNKLLERTLETIERDGDKGWLELVLAAMDFMAKVKGGYAPARLNINQQSELRVAGLSPPELDELMYRRIVELYGERQRHQQLIDTARTSAGLNN